MYELTLGNDFKDVASVSPAYQTMMSSFGVNDDATKVVYCKDEGKELFVADLVSGKLLHPPLK